MYTEITQEEAKRRLEEGSPILLDVRTPKEFAKKHIPGAVNLPLDEVAGQASVIIPDRFVEVLIYCRSGRRALMAAKVLDEAGYQRVHTFGGLEEWKYEVETKR